MGKDEPSLVPEWYKSVGKGGHNANSDDNVDGSSSRNRLHVIPGDRGSRRGLGSEGYARSSDPAYSSFGRRDRNVGSGSSKSIDSSLGSRVGNADSWRSNSGESWLKGAEGDLKSVDLSSDNSSSGSRSASSLKRDFPLLGAEEGKGVRSNSSKVGGLSWVSALAEGNAAAGGSGSTVIPRVSTDPKLPSDTTLADDLAVRQFKKLIPKAPAVPKFSGFSSSEKSKLRGATRGGDFGAPPKRNQQMSSQLLLVNSALRASTRPDTSKEPQFGNLQVLSREKTAVMSPTKEINSQDVNLDRPINPILKAEITRTSKLSSSSLEAKKAQSAAKKRNEFFNSIRNKTTANTSEILLSVDQKDPVVKMPNQEEKSGDVISANVSVNVLEEGSSDWGNNSRDGVDAFVEDEISQSVENNGETENLSCSESKYLQVDLVDERDKEFMQSLGWDESAGDAYLTPEEISAKVLVNVQEEDSSNWGNDSRDGVDAFAKDKSSHCVENNGENEGLSCSESNYLQADLVDEQDKEFLRSLGWDESAGDAYLTPEEISAKVLVYVQEVDSSNWGNDSRDGVDAFAKDKISHCVENNGENEGLSCSESNYLQADLVDEQDREFLRSLGWDESAGDAYLTPEEVSAKVFVNVQEEGGCNWRNDSRDGVDVFAEDKITQSVENNGENGDLCCSESNYLQVDLDERDKEFLRSLGWDESAGEDYLTPEEISAFIKEYEKLRPFSKFSHGAASISVTQTS